MEERGRQRMHHFLYLARTQPALLHEEIMQMHEIRNLSKMPPAEEYAQYISTRCNPQIRIGDPQASILREWASRQIPGDIIKNILSPITASEVFLARSRIRHDTHFTDYDAKALRFFNGDIDTLLAGHFTRWMIPGHQAERSTTINAEVKKLPVICPNLRPLATRDILYGIYQNVLHDRLKPLVNHVRCRSNRGFTDTQLPHIIIHIIFRTHEAHEQNRHHAIRKVDC